MPPIIESVLREQIAGLRASAGVFVQQRADALAAAEAAATAEAGALARADELERAADELLASIPTPEQPDPALPAN